VTYVNLRGPTGSGKSTIARRILLHETQTEYGEPYINRFGAKRRGWPLHHCMTPVGHVIVHARYDCAQGGCDTERDMDIIEQMISWGIKKYPLAHHLFEGIMISKSKTRWFNFVQNHPGDWHWAWLNTPLEECIRRTMARNGGRPVSEKEIGSGAKTMESQYKAITEQRPHGIRTSLVNSDIEPWSLFK
jgi:hypothetical protein